MADERVKTVDYGEVWIDGRAYKLATDVTYEKTNIFGRKVNQGDPGPDDHPVFSTSVWRDWSGGALVLESNPSTDTSKFYFSTAETQYPGYIGLPPETRKISAPNGETATPWVVGDYLDDLYVAWGANLYRVHPTTMVHTLVGPLPAPASGHGTVYREMADSSSHRVILYIPTSTGYATYSVSTGIVAGPASAAGHEPVTFEVWDDKIWRLDRSGQLRWTNKVATADGDWTQSGWVPDGTTPRNLLSFKDNQGNPCLMIVTDGTTWKHDFANNLLHKDDLWYPRQPNTGAASVVFQGATNIAVGTGIMRYDNQSISATGLDARDGLPTKYRGAIRSMTSGYNALYALLEGQLNVSTESEPEKSILHLGGGDDQMYLSSSDSHNLLMLNNGYGWHYRWDGLGGSPTNVLTSNTKGTYNLWWGSGGHLYTQTLSTIYFNPADPDTAGYPYAERAEHISSRVNWNWLGQDKIMKQIEIDVRKITNGAYVEVYYRTDRDESWTHIGTAHEDGEYRWYVGQDMDEPYLNTLEGEPEKGKYLGVVHEWYQLKFVIVRGTNPNDSPYIRWHSVIARRWLRPHEMWRFAVIMDKSVKDYPVEPQREHLKSVADSQKAVVFSHQNDHHMVELILLKSNEKSGRDESASMSVTLMSANDLDERGGQGASEPVQ